MIVLGNSLAHGLEGPTRAVSRVSCEQIVIAQDICLTYTRGTASSVIVESTGPADDTTNTIARFYSSSDCKDGTQIAEGDVGCIGVSGDGLSSYQSFKIDHRPVGNLPQIPGAVYGTPIRESTPLAARSPQTKVRNSYKAAATQRPNTHGDLRQFDGVTYRLHQIHEAGFRGIRLDEWDDKVHIANLGPAPKLPARALEDAPRNLTMRPRELDDRALNNVCHTAITCANRAYGGAIALGRIFRDVIAAAGADAAAKQQKFGEYLADHPYFRELFFGK